jgi:uncharacterized membrane protein
MALAVVLFVIYVLPSVVAALRQVPNVGSVIVVDLLLGWTLIGWVVAMAMAARTIPGYTSVSSGPVATGAVPLDRGQQIRLRDIPDLFKRPEN